MYVCVCIIVIPNESTNFIVCMFVCMYMYVYVCMYVCICAGFLFALVALDEDAAIDKQFTRSP